MILVRKSEERRPEPGFGQDSWSSVGGDAPQGPGKFGANEAFREGHLIPRSASREILRDTEIITYVYDGSLAYEDSLGQVGVLQAGDFHLMTTGHGVSYSEMNTSPIHPAHIFQLRLSPDQLGLVPGGKTSRFSVAQRRGRLCCVASPGGRDGSLAIHRNAFLYSSILGPGQRLIHPLARGRGAWLHIVSGSLRIEEATLSSGDSAFIEGEASASMESNEVTEILLLEISDLDVHSEEQNGRSALSRARVSESNGTEPGSASWKASALAPSARRRPTKGETLCFTCPR